MTRLPYVRTMFATCMLFQAIYVLCVALWLAFPDLKGHALLPAVFPNFNLLTAGSFIYGFVASMVYGWIAAIIFVIRSGPFMIVRSAQSKSAFSSRMSLSFVW